MSVLINMEMPTSRDPATGRFLNGHNRYEFLNDPTTAEWKPIEEQSGETWKDVPGFEGRYYSLTDIVKFCDNLVAAIPTNFYSGILAVRGWLANIPAADVVPVVHGINKKKDFPGLFGCSVCGWCCDDTYYGDTSEYNYCPNCGALMDGKDGKKS